MTNHNQEIIKLSFNQLKSVACLFTGLENLKEIYLSNNRISSISPLAFRGLTNLKVF